MTIQRLLLAFALMGNLAAQTFIQMSDPQFGMFTKDVDFAHETANLEFAIAAPAIGPIGRCHATGSDTIGVQSTELEPTQDPPSWPSSFLPQQ